MSKTRKLTRRQFLAVSAGALTTATVAACTSGTPASQPAATQPPASTQAAEPTAAPAPTALSEATAAPAAAATRYKEAPMLTELVNAGKLPPVDQRLPANPVVVEPKNAIGMYGGTLKGTGMAPETTNDLQITMVAGLFRFSNDLKEAMPEVAEGYEFSGDNKTCTIKLRQGLKWSDGTPFTSDDMMFYFEDLVFDKDISPTLATQWQPGKQPMQVTRIDDYTVQFDFAVPNPAFALIHYSGAPIEPFRPKNWFSKYHQKYNSEADAAAKALGFNDWKARLTKWALTQWNYGAMEPDTPVLGPWRPVATDSQRQQYERNPYYWKVDSEGNQLPYVDKCTVEYVANLDVANLKAISGEVSVSGLDLLLINYPVLKDSEQSGDYSIRLVYSERGADVAVALNQVHPDPELAKIFGDVRFRQAMSAAINRDEINELVFLGEARRARPRSTKARLSSSRNGPTTSPSTTRTRPIACWMRWGSTRRTPMAFACAPMANPSSSCASIYPRKAPKSRPSNWPSSIGPRWASRSRQPSASVLSCSPV